MSPKTSEPKEGSTSEADFTFAATHFIEVGSASCLSEVAWGRRVPNDLSVGAREVEAGSQRAVPSVSRSRTMTLQNRAETELERYRMFSFGWDGYYGEVFQPEVIDAAKRLVRKISLHFLEAESIPSEITPGPASDGSVDVEVEFMGRRIIFSIFPDSTKVNVFKERNEEAVEEYPVPADELDLDQELNWLAV